MAEQDIGLIDRLQERGLIDRYGFMFFALAGSLAILAAKYVVLETWIVAVGAITFMVVYALLVNMRGTGKLRSDQAGDNCYYLGLIFTLTSLAYAIFNFDPEDTATTIVQGFGIALATTIVGLVLRVFFSQSRVDLYEIEETARLELSEAAGQLRAELSQIALEFKEFGFGLQQSVKEMRDEASESITNTAEKSIETVRALASEVSELLSKQASDLAESASVLAKKTGSVSRSLEKHSASIDQLSEAHEIIAADVGLMAEATKMMNANAKVALEQSTSAREVQTTTSQVIVNVDAATSKLRETVASLLTSIQKFEGEFAVRLKSLEDGPKDTADKALAAIAKAAGSVDEAMGRLQEVQEASIRSVGTATNGLLTVVKGHNDGLEAELSRSRENVQKVHNALVDMTTKLNDKFE